MNSVDRVVEAVAETARNVESNIASQVGADGGENPSGETQIAADVWADRQFFEALADLEGVGEYVSEERESAVDCGTGYSVAIDPLDGSSNLATNNVVGTIVGVYEDALPAPGRDLVAAVMVLYGPYTTMTVARTDEGPQEYLLQDGGRESLGTVSFPADPTVVGIAGMRGERGEAFDALTEDLAGELKLRYGGATVGDLAQILEYGGLFGYPASTGYPDGKLRVHFEAAPLAYIVEAAGGESTDGRQSLLEVDPDGLHERTPTFLGDPALVARVETALGD